MRLLRVVLKIEVAQPHCFAMKLSKFLTWIVQNSEEDHLQFLLILRVILVDHQPKLINWVKLELKLPCPFLHILEVGGFIKMHIRSVLGLHIKL